MKTLTEKFIEEVARIKQPEYFIGVARILKADLMRDGEPLEFDEIFTQVIDKYDVAPRKRKKELLHILREANKTEES